MDANFSAAKPCPLEEHNPNLRGKRKMGYPHRGSVEWSGGKRKPIPENTSKC